MTVYFLQVGDTGPIKIGYCRNGRAWQRWRDLQGAHHADLTIVGLLVGGVETEAMLHAYFHKLRLRGEWFRCGVRLKRLIDRLPNAHKDGQMPKHKIDLADLKIGKLTLQRI